jgi:hypothetical protein
MDNFPGLQLYRCIGQNQAVSVIYDAAKGPFIVALRKKQNREH